MTRGVAQSSADRPQPHTCAAHPKETEHPLVEDLQDAYDAAVGDPLGGHLQPAQNRCMWVYRDFTGV